jgi:hypothetical protein
VLDAQGNVVADSTGLAPRHANRADKDYFKVHAAKPDAGLFLSQPFTDGAADRWSVGLSRRINAKDGSFDGILVGTIADAPHLIRQADAVLYAAKGAGRNRVVCSEVSEAMRAAA